MSIGACGRALWACGSSPILSVITSRGAHQLFWNRTPTLSLVPKDRAKFEMYVRKTAAVVRVTTTRQATLLLGAGSR